ncbi:MAG: CoA pyrophosphatase [Micrococcales bacterium]|nr:CoA pyrophosphatase [Micrococcales bacterium]
MTGPALPIEPDRPTDTLVATHSGPHGVVVPGPAGWPRPEWLSRAVHHADEIDPTWFSRFQPPDDGGRESAVLMLFAPPPAKAAGDGEHVVLTERSHTMRSHPAQISFPGGGREPADHDLVATALREGWEETGLEPDGVDIVGVLPSLFLRPSANLVAPVIGWWAIPTPIGVRDPGEVHDVLVVPIAHLLDPATRFTVVHPSGFRGPAFDIDGLLLWGFTAGLVDKVLELGGRTIEWDRSRERPLPDRHLTGRRP